MSADSFLPTAFCSVCCFLVIGYCRPFWMTVRPLTSTSGLTALRVFVVTWRQGIVTLVYLSRPEARFTIAHGVRPVGGVIGRIVQAAIRELDQQTVAPPFAVKEA